MMELKATRVETGGTVLLEPLTLKLERGKRYALCGPNGSGKSTLLRLMAGLLAPSEGSVLLDERDLKVTRPEDLARKRIWLPQRHSLSFTLAVREVVTMGSLPFNNERRTDAVIARAIERLNLQSLEERIYTSLSGGEQQRTQIARCLVQLWLGCAAKRQDESVVVLLDEPWTGLDLNHQNALMRLVGETDPALGRDAIWVIAEHDLNIAAAIADEVILLHRGRSIARGDPKTVLSEEHLKNVFGVTGRWVEHSSGEGPGAIRIDW